jgi:hypothetical protein
MIGNALHLTLVRAARAGSLVVLLLVGLSSGGAQSGVQALDPSKPYRGFAVLSSVIGGEVPLAELEAFVRECKIDLVVIDFCWITYHWPRTKLATVERLAASLRKRGIAVAAMYRARALRPAEARVHLARKRDGTIPASHNDLCLAHPDSVDWGAAWGEKILEACPSISRIILYNVRASCACRACRGGRGRTHVGKFFATCRKRWKKIRAGVRIGHVAMGLDHADRIDFFCPFLIVNRRSPSEPVDIDRLIRQAATLRERARGKPVVPLAKICWASATRNTTEDVVRTIQSAGKARLGFLMWYYGWIFHSTDGRYDPEPIVEALGGDWGKLEKLIPSRRRPAQKKRGPKWFVHAASRESRNGQPPRLVIHTRDQRTRKLIACDDATLIKYLANGSYGSMKQLAIGLEDQNRTLIRFRLPKSLRAASVSRAELVLDITMPERHPPRFPVEITVHAVKASWDEKTVSWNSQPGAATDPVLTATLAPRAGIVRWDVTALVRRWLGDRKSNHGVLLKQGGITAFSAEALLTTLPWLNDPAAALEKARAEKRLVLACVRGAFKADAENLAEQLLMAIVFANPAIVDLVKHRFIPLRVWYPPSTYTNRRDLGARDPLRPLGTDATTVKAPALTVSTPRGKLIARLESIGTFDPELTYRFLQHALAKAPALSRPTGDTAEALLRAGALDAAARAFRRLASPARDYGLSRIAALRRDHALAVRLAHDAAKGSSRVACDARVQGAVSLMRQGDLPRAERLFGEALAHRPASPRQAEAAYYLACLEQRTGRTTTAEERLGRIVKEHPGSLWALKARARLAWPDRIPPAENLTTLPLNDKRAPTGLTEQPVAAAHRLALIRRAVAYLIEQQTEDGSWPVEHAPFRCAVTALVAKALDAWSSKLPQAGIEDAVGRATTWIHRHLAGADPRSADSFGAAYALDFLLARYRRQNDAPSRKAAQKGVEFLLGGQCPNGAWSYSHRFNASWRGGFGGWPKTTTGRVHSMNTGPALLCLAWARKRGLDVDQRALNRAIKVLKKMRVDPGVYTYTYPVPLNFSKPDQSIARGPVCEHALFAAGATSRKNLHTAVKRFLQYRDALRIPVKLNKSWGNPHCFSSYFYFYAYYHAALAIRALGKRTAAPLLKSLRDDILAVPEMDATWVDYHQGGKPYGTAMALLVLAMAEGQTEKGG